MSHEITETDNMAYVGARPWHGLGNELPRGATVEEMQEAAGLTWEVRKDKIRIVDAKNGGRLIKDHFSLTRTDNGECLDVVGRQYVPVSPGEALSFFKRFADVGDLTMETAGSLCGGRWVWGLARHTKSVAVADHAEEELRNYVLLVSPNIHGKSLVIKQTSVRVVCWNTMTAALGSTGERFALRHVREFNEQEQEAAAEAIGLSLARFNRFHAAAEKMVKVALSREGQVEYLKRVFRLDAESIALRRKLDLKEVEESRRTSPITNKFVTALDSAPGADLPTARETLWGAFNAVTYLCDHVLGKDVDTRLRESWLGGRENTKQRALRLAEELIVA